jgi:tetratricopeptide (TPR) repeat protein/tRNA A-37 threonylcarbamoyl transferase component Bud32
MDTDRNLLFGVLALQADLIDPARFAEACSAWAAQKTQLLADLLEQRGWITGEERQHVEFLLDRKLRKHQGDAHASLSAVADSRVRALVAQTDDAELQRSLAGLSSTNGPTLVSTIAYRPEARDRYALTRLHAKGGLGQVWLAHDRELGRHVALKELRPERAGDQVLHARFLEEAQVTGQLEHPGIVPVYELARRDADGRPYYTMRFIKGRTLAEAAREYHRRREEVGAAPLDLAGLLNAFVGVCNAIAYAHSRGVIHRDLKPQNVVLGDFGEVVVLDWGLAKLVGREETTEDLASIALGESDMHTATIAGQVLGTPAYMAPEQAEGGSVDRRSDVYGLGAILYEILTGRPPFTESETRALLRRVVTEPPARPREIVPTTPRPLESVCLKALSKAPSQRYASATELADEVRHFLADEPVRVYREPLPARAGRWMRGHRTLVSGAGILLVTVLTAAALGLVVLGRKNREVATAAAQAQAVNDFLTEDLLGQADPDVNDREKKVTVEALLRKAAGKIDGNVKFASQPEVEATLRLTLGKTFFKLSDLREAEKHLRRALEIRRTHLLPDDPRTLAAAEALADFLNRGLERPAEAERLAYQTWQARGRVLGPEHRDTLDSMDTYASTLGWLGHLNEGIELDRQCLAARRRTLGPSHPDTLTSMNNLADFLLRAGAWSECIPLLKEGLEIQAVSRQETEYATMASNLVHSYYLEGDIDAAERLLVQSLDRATRRLGPDITQTDRLRGLQVRVWLDQGDAQLPRAVALGRDVLALRRKTMSSGHAAIAQLQMDLGQALVRTGQFGEAHDALVESVAIFRTARAHLAHYPAWAECWLGASLAGLNRHEEAEAHLLEAERGLRKARTTPLRHYRESLERLVRLYDVWDKPAESARWREKLAAERTATVPRAR